LERHGSNFKEAGGGSPSDHRHLIARGPLLSDDGSEWVGSAMLVEFPDRPAVGARLAPAPFVQAGLYEGVEIHDWQFGGRS
jgi:uncharacterized protein